MKIKTLSLAALLSIAAIGCQKEPPIEPSSAMQNTPSEAKTTYIMHYSVNGTPLCDTLYSEAQLDAFYDSMLGLAYIGNTINIYSNTTTTPSVESRDTVTYTTNNAEKAKAWMKQKIDDGYDITLVFNQETGKYTCTATK